VKAEPLQRDHPTKFDDMNFTRHPRLLARIAGVFYVVIIVFALFAYLYVRGQLIVPNMAQTAINVLAHERLYRLGFSAAVIVVICNLPLGWICFELFKVVNPRLALLALVFITAAATIEAVNLFNYITPLFIFSLPEFSAFDAFERQALARAAIRLFGYGFSVSLTFFSVFCALIGYLILRSTYLPRLLGLLMLAAGATYCIENFALFLALPEIPYIRWVTLVAESSLALWLLTVGINEGRWQAQAVAAVSALRAQRT
jgi:hypothetical protein